MPSCCHNFHFQPADEAVRVSSVIGQPPADDSEVV